MKKYSLLFIVVLLLQTVFVNVQPFAAEKNASVPTWSKPIDYVALGDSLSFGIDSNGAISQSFVDYLTESLSVSYPLRSANKGFSFPLYTTTDLLTDFQNNVVKPSLGIGNAKELKLQQAIKEAELITISAGANDVLPHIKINASTGLPEIDLVKLLAASNKISSNYRLLLQEIYKINPQAQVFVMGYYNPFPYLQAEWQPKMNQLLDQLNKAIAIGLQDTNTVFVSTNEKISKNVTEYLPNPQNIHPNEAGYRVITEAFKEAIQSKYKELSPTTFTATVKNETTVQLQWEPAFDDKGVAAYRIYQGDQQLVELSGDVQSYDVTSLEKNKVYTFTIVAEDADKNRSETNPSVTIATGSQPGADAIFHDITNHWAKLFIEQAAATGVVKGYPDGKFKPENKLTRAQAASIIVRSLNLIGNQRAPFSDVSGYSAETQAEIAAAYQFGIIKGQNDKFHPNAFVTRTQLALMVKRSYELSTGKPYIATQLAPFTDIANVDEETKTAISMLYTFGIVEGSEGKFMPSNPTTRAQAAKIFVNYAKMGN